MNIVEIKPGRYFIGAWYLYDATNPALSNQDWMATVFREAGEERWHLRYRHKYYHSPDPFDPEDRRSSFQGTMSGKTEMEIIESVEKAVDQLQAHGGFKRDFVYMGTDDAETIFERLKSRPWAHLQIREIKTAITANPVGFQGSDHDAEI